MEDISLFKKEESRQKNEKSKDIFQEINRIKKEIHFEIIQNKSHAHVGPLFSQWTYELGMTIKRESDLHAHCLGKQIRLTQWHAELYCLAKRYNDSALDILNRFHLQHLSLYQIVQNIPVGTSSLLWKKIEQLVENLTQLHHPMVLFFSKKYAYSYRIPIDDIKQISWMVLVESIHSFDPDMNFSFINYFNIKLRTTLLRSYGKSCEIILSEKEMMKFMRIKYLLYKHADNENDPSFIKKCQVLFGEDIYTLMDDYHKKENILSVNDIEKVQLYDTVNTIEEQVEQNMQSNLIHQALQKIDPLTREILLMNFGFKNNTNYTREEIASELDLELHVVKRLKKNGLEKLKRIMSST